MKIYIERTGIAKTLPMPSYATAGSAGIDLHAAVEKDVVLQPLCRELIPTGIVMCHIPEYFELQIRSRSGLSSNHGVIVLNAPATIDSDYRGELKLLLMNLGKTTFTITCGMRLAQIVFARYEKVVLAEAQSGQKTVTARGNKGFGSSGL